MLAWAEGSVRCVAPNEGVRNDPTDIATLRHAALRNRAALVLVMSIGLLTPASAQNSTRVVQPGESIQGAIDASAAGDRILVSAGTYAERLTIDKDGISLIGLGAVLVPPNPTQPTSETRSNTCSGLAGPGTEAGICITGTAVVLAPFVVEHRKFVSVGKQVNSASITGFQVSGFSGANIAVVGARDAKVFGNRLADSDQYGLLTVGSVNTRFTANTVSSSDRLRFIGICMDNVGGVQVAANHISGYNIALCVQTAGADVRGNDISASCIGAFIDPGINGAKIRDNHVRATNPRCLTQGTFGSFGIFVFGAVNTDVRRNRIEGQAAGGRAGGLVVVDDPDSGSIASGNVVTHNILRNNDLDLYMDSTGPGNVFAHNLCLSDPANPCS